MQTKTPGNNSAVEWALEGKGRSWEGTITNKNRGKRIYRVDYVMLWINEGRLQERLAHELGKNDGVWLEVERTDRYVREQNFIHKEKARDEGANVDQRSGGCNCKTEQAYTLPLGLRLVFAILPTVEGTPGPKCKRHTTNSAVRSFKLQLPDTAADATIIESTFQNPSERET